MPNASPSPANFNFIARPYRWLEYLSLGPLLSRTRNQFLHRLEYTRRALVLGDGDGRFTLRLLDKAPSAHVTAVDASRTMLRLLTRRARPFAPRLTTHHTDALTYTPTDEPDLIVTHFFLDCLTQSQVEALAIHLAACSSPNVRWLLSEFAVPRGLLHFPARFAIRMLYLAFFIFTGLRVTRLPDYAAALRAAGFIPIARRDRLFGILTAQLWRRA